MEKQIWHELFSAILSRHMSNSKHTKRNKKQALTGEGV